MFSLPAWYIRYTEIYEPENLTEVVKDVVNQFDHLWNHTFHQDDGLLVHGYDESKTASWANAVTGASPIVWGRALGWHAVGLLETLEILPYAYPAARPLLQSRFNELIRAITDSVDQSGAWWQVLDQGGRQGNYLESSCTALFTYTILRGARHGYLDTTTTSPLTVGKRAWEYMRDSFVVKNMNGTISWNETVTVCSLNSTATYEACFLSLTFSSFANELQYYVSQPILFNSLIGSSAFVLASLEYERLCE